MSYYRRGRKEAQLVEWSGCFWIVCLTTIVGAVVYYFAVPFMRVVYTQVDYLSIIGGW